MNKTFITLLAFVFFAGLYWLKPNIFLPTFDKEPSAEENKNTDILPCIQVITPARNPETGQIKEFATPCDVPDGWEEIQNDIPDLDFDPNLDLI